MSNVYKQRAYLAIKERRISAERAAEAVAAAVAADPSYAALNAECVKLGFQIARLGATKQDVSDLKRTLEEKKALRAARLKELGYSEEDLSPRYICPVCKDTGIVDGRDCRCLRELLYAELRSGAPGIPTESDSFDEGITKLLPEELGKEYVAIYKILSRYAEDFPDNKYTILGLCGNVGSGKSYAVGVLSNIIMRKGYSVLYINAVQLNNLFLRYHTAPLQEKQGIMEPLIETDLLVIDDLGAENVLNNVTANHLYSLLVERSRKHIVITSNLTFQNMRERYGARIASRFADTERSLFYVLHGKDLRFIKK